MSMSRKVLSVLAGLLAIQLAATPALAASEQQSQEELRDTVINLLQALVEQGVITKEKAQALVKQAQDKAAADAAKLAETDKGAVRVPYVPQIVKDEISKQVAQQVEPAVVADVEKKAQAEGWGVPAALPDWLSHVRMYGEVTVRAQADWYAKNNTANTFQDFQAINTAGVFNPQNPSSYLNVTEDRYRERLRARLGIVAQLSSEVTSGIRISSGSLTDPSSESQTLTNSFARDTIALDEAFVRWDSNPLHHLFSFSAVGGRFLNPWLAPTQLIFARDVTFEGGALTARLGPESDTEDRSHAFVTFGGFPIQEIPFANSNNKWLVAAQLGGQLVFEDGQRLRFGGAYYDFIHVTGRASPVDTTLYSYTAPAFIRFGNTTFNILSSSTNPNVALYGLAAKFKVANVNVQYEIPVGGYRLSLTADAAKNVGYKSSDIESLTGVRVPAKTNGYVAEIRFGDPDVDEWLRWRALVGYRYVQRDAVLDSITDADFHEGGTNAQGYIIGGELGLTHNTFFRLRYMSGNIIDAPQTMSNLLLKYGLDILQLDLGARF